MNLAIGRKNTGGVSEILWTLHILMLMSILPQLVAVASWSHPWLYKTVGVVELGILLIIWWCSSTPVRWVCYVALAASAGMFLPVDPETSWFLVPTLSGLSVAAFWSQSPTDYRKSWQDVLEIFFDYRKKSDAFVLVMLPGLLSDLVWIALGAEFNWSLLVMAVGFGISLGAVWFYYWRYDRVKLTEE